MRRKKIKSKIDKTIQEKGIIEIIEEEISFRCPKRGLVRQKVKVKKFKPFKVDSLDMIHASDAASEIEELDDGLNIYSSDDKDPE